MRAPIVLFTYVNPLMAMGEQAFAERARDELFKILALPNAVHLIRQLDAFGLLAAPSG